MPKNQSSVNTRCAHIWVKGRVQGVGFRAYVEHQAAKLAISGWVRNVGYDTVEVVAEGSAGQIQQFIEIVRQGPRMSRVDEIRVEEEAATGFLSFSVRYSA